MLYLAMISVWKKARERERKKDCLTQENYTLHLKAVFFFSVALSH